MEVKSWSSSQSDQYPLLIGKLLANISTLEFALRTVLYQQTVPKEKQSAVSTRFTNLREGDEVDGSPLTSWDSFGKLEAKYNCLNPKNKVPAGIKDVRDAFAHGRILTDDPSKPLKLVRFAQPDEQGKVRVEMAETLTVEWLGQQIKLVHNAVLAVHLRLNE
ncbi:MAG: hypothetical protein WDM77_08770 [Steroidobacteraceae bacterium]